jgi:hypothetical protein
MLAAFSIYFAGTAVVLVWRDLLALSLALTLLAGSALHSLGAVGIPWILFLAAAVALASRVIWILFFFRERVLFVGAWRRAKETAAIRCPKRRTS